MPIKSKDILTRENERIFNSTLGTIPTSVLKNQFQDIIDSMGVGNSDSTLTTYITQTGNYTLSDYTATDGVCQDWVITGNSTNTLGVPTTMVNGLSKWQNGNGNSLDNTKVNYVYTCAKNGHIFYNTIKTAVPAGADVTAPAIVSASTNSAGTIVTYTFSEALNTSITPAVGDFTFSPSKTVTNVSVIGSTVLVTVSVAFVNGNVITSSYTPATNKIQDLSGNFAAALSGYSVTNNVPVFYHTSNFTGANNTLITAYTPEVGSSWIAGTGTADIQGNEASVKTFSGNVCQMVTDVGQTNYTITTSAIKSLNSDFIQIIARYTDANNFIVANISTDIYCGLYNVVGGTATLITSISQQPSSVYNTFDFIVSGTSLLLKKNGVTIASGTIPTAQAGTKVGFGSAGTSISGAVKFNYFNVNQ